MSNKRILIEIPTWLGDAVMTTPAIENIVDSYLNCKIIFFGSFVSTNIFLKHPNLDKIIVDNSKTKGNRYLNLIKLAKQVGNVDIAFSFRRNFSTLFFLWFVDAKEKYRYKRYSNNKYHQVLRYNDFINNSLKINKKVGNLKLYTNKIKEYKETKRTLGINPGATYGSAKRWYPEEFAKVAIKLSFKYDIVIFGGKNEIKIANDIENILVEANITNYTNLAGKTDIEFLINKINTLDLFITNDSGPMHLAAAFQIPTVCIFGPTNFKETSQWNNDISIIISKDFDCMPCMKRVCPLADKSNHQCMKTITAKDVLNAIFANIEALEIKKKKLQWDFLHKYNIKKNTKIILFTANNFKQNGIVDFFNIVSQINSINFQIVVSGNIKNLNYAKIEAKNFKFKVKILFLESFAMKICDIFILPTKNKRFSISILKAMKLKCAVFIPSSNQASAIVDIFSTMRSPNDPNTIHKIDALLKNPKHLKLVQKENKLKAKTISI